MKKRLFSLTVAVLVLVAMLNVAVPVSATPATFHVGTGYPYSDIQAAIDDADSGDTIIVHPGTYGPIIVDKKLTIKGNNAIIAGTILPGPPAPPYEIEVYIEADGVVFCGFTVDEVTYADTLIGICVVGKNARITNNKIYPYGEYNCYGIYVDGAGACISNNRIVAVGQECYGIHILGADARISNNNIQVEGGNCFGIIVYGDNPRISTNNVQVGGGDCFGIMAYGDNARISRNNVQSEGNEYAYCIYVSGNGAYISKNKIDADAFASWAIDIYGNDARILNNDVQAEGEDVSDGIYIVGGNAMISRNNINCKVGIYAESCYKLNIQRNTINADAVGIWLYSSSQSRIESNTITGLTCTNYYSFTNAYGIIVDDAQNNLLHDNTIIGSNVANSIGIWLNTSTSGNSLVLNAISAVGTKIVDEGTGNRFFSNWR